MLFGAVADDLTGATDLSLMLSREGMKTIQVIGVPGADVGFGDADAVVVALKSRTIAPDEAVAMSLDAARSLLAAGAEQLMFKYCSTFDSTARGNIGPVAEALMDLVGTDFTMACPAFPATGRSIYKGYLFVGDMLLSESPMRNHPLTPMRDSNLARVLQEQTRGAVGLVDLNSVEEGVGGVAAAFSRARGQGQRIAIVDAVRDEHLRTIGSACAGMKLITGGSGIAMGLPDNFRRAGKLRRRAAPEPIVAPLGKTAIIAGSCSTATRRQVEMGIAAGFPALRVDALDLAEGKATADGIADWAIANARFGVPIIYSSVDPEAVAGVQARLGREHAGALVEGVLAAVGRRLSEDGFTRFVVAGGETSGAVVGALGVAALQIGPEIDPGVPWTLGLGARPLALALKSGNFGAPDFFMKALKMLDGTSRQ